MKYLNNFINIKNIEKAEIFQNLKCSKDEAIILQLLLREYLLGNDDLIVSDILIRIYGRKDFKYLNNLVLIKNLLGFDWIVQNGLNKKVIDISNLELLNISIGLSSLFFKMIEKGSLDFILPKITPYIDDLEYFQDKFLQIELYQKLHIIRQDNLKNSPTLYRMNKRVEQLENIIFEKIKITKKVLSVEKIFIENKLSKNEKIIFLSLLKEEYSGSDDGNLRDMNMLIDLISINKYDKIKNRALLEDGSKLLKGGFINYDEILTSFGGIGRNFFITDKILKKIIHQPKSKEKKREKRKKVVKIKLNSLVKKQEIFEFIKPKISLDKVVLNVKTEDTLNIILKQVNSDVSNLLKEWGIKDKKGIDAKIIFYGVAGTGKTMSALALAKSMKREVLSLDCSKILSMYIGESEKNVRKIFDSYKALSKKVKVAPILLLNEADQFLSTRTTSSLSSADKMHNQMQNIFLEQIENFEGILIATTNLLETLDPAFSRRFDYKIEFKKPDYNQRLKIWDNNLPKKAKYEKEFKIEKLAKYNLTGGQIKLVLKNTAYSVAVRNSHIFTIQDFISEIEKELKGNFDSEKSVGFLA